MKFHVRQNELAKALNRLKVSKAIGKPEEEEFSTMLIQAKKENGKNVLKFTVTNTTAWASTSISQDYFEGLVGDDHNKLFDVEEEGELFVDGHPLINLINAYPESINVNFTVQSSKNSDGKDEAKNLITSFSQKLSNGKTQKRTNQYLIKSPSYFNANPPDEDRKEVSIGADKLEKAIMAVEFASSMDEKHRQFWGCFLEIYSDSVACCATDKSKICWFDREGLERDKEKESPFTVSPIKTTLVAAIKALSLDKPVTVRSGSKFIILEQDDQWHAIPSVQFGLDDETEVFDWRTISNNVSDTQEASFTIPRKTLLDCVKTSTATLGGKFGIKIRLNTENKKIIFSVQRIEGGGVVNSDELDLELDDSQVTGDVDITIILTIDSIKEIATRYSSEDVVLRVKDNDFPVEFVSSKDPFRYITATVDPPSFDNSNDEDENNGEENNEDSSEE